LQSLIEQGLEQTASLWPDIERADKWIHQVAHILNNHEDEDAATVQRRSWSVPWPVTATVRAV
jgi:hypothetical protein